MKKEINNKQMDNSVELHTTHVDSTSDERTVNNVMRHQYKVLGEDEKFQMQRIKDLGLEMHEYISGMGSSRELSLALTKVEEAVMWSVKFITK